MGVTTEFAAEVVQAVRNYAESEGVVDFLKVGDVMAAALLEVLENAYLEGQLDDHGDDRVVDRIMGAENMAVAILGGPWSGKVEDMLR